MANAAAQFCQSSVKTLQWDTGMPHWCWRRGSFYCILSFDSSLHTTFCGVLIPHCMVLRDVILHFALVKVCILCANLRDLTRPDTMEPKLLLYNSLGADWIACMLLLFALLSLGRSCSEMQTETQLGVIKKEDTTQVRKQWFKSSLSLTKSTLKGILLQGQRPGNK